MKRMKWTGEKTVNLCLFFVSAIYLAYSLSNYKLGTVRMPKEGFMPMLVGGGATLISAFLLVQSLFDKGDAQHVKFNISWLRFFLLVAISLAYALLLNTVGYLICTFVFLLAVLKIAGVEGWVKPLVIALVATAAFYLLFKVALGVMLPAGWLGL